MLCCHLYVSAFTSNNANIPNKCICLNSGESVNKTIISVDNAIWNVLPNSLKNNLR